jgi:hypothetical protein
MKAGATGQLAPTTRIKIILGARLNKNKKKMR